MLQVPLRMSVDAISFSAHADYTQTSQFIAALAPPHVVLVSPHPGMQTPRCYVKRHMDTSHSPAVLHVGKHGSDAATSPHAAEQGSAL